MAERRRRVPTRRAAANFCVRWILSGLMRGPRDLGRQGIQSPRRRSLKWSRFDFGRQSYTILDSIIAFHTERNWKNILRGARLVSRTVKVFLFFLAGPFVARTRLNGTSCKNSWIIVPISTWNFKAPPAWANRFTCPGARFSAASRM